MKLDINKIIIDAVKVALTKQGKKTYDYSFKHAVINMSAMYIDTGKTTYDKTSAGKKGGLKADIVYSAVFTNKTHSPQVYALNTSRETSTVSEFSHSRTWTLGAEIKLKHDLETDVDVAELKLLSASGGGQHSRQKGDTVISEHQMTWGVDSKVTVPGKHWVLAQLVITEEEFRSDFEMTTTFDGEVVVHLLKRDKSIANLMDEMMVYNVVPVHKIKGQYEEFRMNVRNIFTPKLGFVNDAQGRPTFKTKGECKCRIGVEQEIIISEFLGEPPEDNDPTIKSLEKEAGK
ncbi:unnamed protein product [Lymnaea stagnalis]|uniref:Uncharacterized protein n=1 Tax=Lymnaea stagnalis TaxID=6523 RepID=A0AAV2IHA3_LYMST